MYLVGRPAVWSFFDDTGKAKQASNVAIRGGPGCFVTSYMDLATKIAELQYRNNDLILVFRGQRSDHRSKAGSTTIKPTLFRPRPGGFSLKRSVLEERLKRLEAAGNLLKTKYEAAFRLGRTKVLRERLLRWAVLQHYEVCETPLLDVSHSVRIAASFASVRARNEAYFMVLGIPYLSGGVSVSAETGLQIVRLSSVCPPSAVRPHIQEGYLIGEYPEIAEIGQAKLYTARELDFGRRLVAKFRFNPATFWPLSKYFAQVPESALYPSASEDPLKDVADHIKKSIEGMVATNVRA